MLRWQVRAQQQVGQQLMVEEVEAQTELLVRQMLRQFPYWAKGHLWLAQHCLARNNLEVAFASGNAVLKLQGAARNHAKARRILACCRMKAGDYAGARTILSELSTSAPDWWEVREDYAAALIYAGEFAKAVEELAKIPESQLSGEGRAALEFARSKIPPVA